MSSLKIPEVSHRASAPHRESRGRPSLARASSSDRPHTVCDRRRGPPLAGTNYGVFDYKTHDWGWDSNGVKRTGADYSIYVRGSSNYGCTGFSGWYSYDVNTTTPQRHWRIRRQQITAGHCPRTARIVRAVTVLVDMRPSILRRLDRCCTTTCRRRHIHHPTHPRLGTFGDVWGRLGPSLYFKLSFVL